MGKQQMAGDQGQGGTVNLAELAPPGTGGGTAVAMPPPGDVTAVIETINQHTQQDRRAIEEALAQIERQQEQSDEDYQKRREADDAAYEEASRHNAEQRQRLLELKLRLDGKPPKMEGRVTMPVTGRRGRTTKANKVDGRTKLGRALKAKAEGKIDGRTKLGRQMKAQAKGKGKAQATKGAAKQAPTGQRDTDKVLFVLQKMGESHTNKEIADAVMAKYNDMTRPRIDAALQSLRGRMVNGKQQSATRVRVTGEPRAYKYKAVV